MAKTPKSYKQLTEELAAIVYWFESDLPQVDQAVEKYEQAVRLIAEIESYLKNAENKLRKLSVTLD